MPAQSVSGHWIRLVLLAMAAALCTEAAPIKGSDICTILGTGLTGNLCQVHSVCQPSPARKTWYECRCVAGYIPTPDMDRLGYQLCIPMPTPTTPTPKPSTLPPTTSSMPTTLPTTTPPQTSEVTRRRRRRRRRRRTRATRVPTTIEPPTTSVSRNEDGQ
eukprot:scpid86145/ scgid29497/ 